MSPRPDDAARRRGLWVCAGLSLVLHGALAAAWQPAPAARGSALAAPAPKRSPLQVRWLVTTPAVDANAVIAAPADHAPPPDAGTLPAQAVVTARAEDPPTPEDRDAGPATPAEDAAVAAEGFDAYLPRPLLTVGPQPRDEIRVDYPDDGPEVGRFVATLSLYIDDAGQVRRVEVADDPALPEALRRAARQAFEYRQFSPGELDGRRVKSRLRIELVYESRAVPSLATRSDALASADAARTE